MRGLVTEKMQIEDGEHGLAPRSGLMTYWGILSLALEVHILVSFFFQGHDVLRCTTAMHPTFAH